MTLRVVTVAAIVGIVAAWTYSPGPIGTGRASRAASRQWHGGKSRGPRAVVRAGKKDNTVEQIPLSNLIGDLETVRSTAVDEIMDADTEALVNDLRVKYLGKKGKIQAFMSQMRALSNEDKPKLGAVVNKAKGEVERLVATQLGAIEERKFAEIIAEEELDVTLPGLPQREVGHRHPLSLTMEKATNIFRAMGFDVVSGALASPEIETDYYCFTALNCPADHPARDMQDTFYLELPDDDSRPGDGKKLLRTHTSAVQIREMERRTPPFRIVAPGRVYRRDEIDATHSPMFHQIEILALDEKGKLNLNHLKGTIEYFLRQMFGEDIKVRYRGSYFPFTEPSMEVDVYFKDRWLEVLGCGMVDPRVLRMAGIDPDKYGGFAAGFGVERFAMVTHAIPDIRLFYNGDSRFLSQFPQYLSHDLGDDLKGDYNMDEDTISRINQVPLDSGTEEPVVADPAQYAESMEQLPWISKTAENAAAEQKDVEQLDEGEEEIPDIDHPESYPPEFLEQEWEVCFGLLEAFKAETGSCKLPWNYHIPNHSDPRKLDRWCDVQRLCQSTGELKSNYEARLIALGFDWDDNDA